MPSLDTDSRRWFSTLIHATRSHHRRQMVMQASRHSIIEMAITWDSTLLSLQWRARSSNWELRQYAPCILCTPGAILHFQLWSSKRILSVKFVCPFCQSQQTKWQNIFFLLNVFSFSILLESSQSKVSGRSNRRRISLGDSAVKVLKFFVGRLYALDGQIGFQFSSDHFGSFQRFRAF